MDSLTATTEFAGILRVGSTALRQVLAGDDAATAKMDAQFKKIYRLLDRLDGIAENLQKEQFARLTRRHPKRAPARCKKGDLPHAHPVFASRLSGLGAS